MRTKNKKLFVSIASILGCAFLASAFVAMPTNSAIADTSESNRISLLDPTYTSQYASDKYNSNFGFQKGTLTAVNGYNQQSRTFDVETKYTNAAGEATTVIEANLRGDYACYNSNGLWFQEKLEVADVHAVEIVMYAHFSSGSNYGVDYGGVRLFSTDDTGVAGEGFMLPSYITQKQWITLTVAGPELLKLADNNGYLSGLQFGSACQYNNSASFYAGTEPYLLIESITAITDEEVEADESISMFYETLPANKWTFATTSTLKQVNGSAVQNTRTFDLENVTGSNGETTRVVEALLRGDSVLADSIGVPFATRIKADKIKSLDLMVYANFSSQSNYYCTDQGGVRLFSLDATGAAGEGYMIPSDIQQRTWVKITLTGDDITKLADSNGYISGLQFGNWCQFGDATKFYTGTEGYLWIESVVATIHSTCVLNGHTWVDADCDTPKTCSVCSVTEGEALGHAWVDATCTAPKTCSVCSTTEGEALGHTWVDATCTAPKTCSVCSATEGEALGHSYGEWTVTKEASATEAGSKERICSACEEKETEVIPATGVEDEDSSNAGSSEEDNSSNTDSSDDVVDSSLDDIMAPFGCSGTVSGIGFGALLLVAASAIVLKKKED